jgi:hypothetical protein
VLAPVLGVLLWCAPALASPGDVAATSAYLQANLAFVRSATSVTRRVEATLHVLPAKIAGECAGAAQGSPEDPDSEQLSNELIGYMVISADRVDLSAAHVYLAAIAHLNWSNAGLTRTIRSYAADVKRLAALNPPALCADVRSWSASGFTKLAPSTVAFDSVFMNVWVAPGDLPAALKRYETPSERSLVARTVQMEYEIAELETREETTWWNTMDLLYLWP